MTPRPAPVLVGASVALLATVAFLGDSAAVPGLGPAAWHPPYDVAAGAPSWLVTGLVVIAYLLGALGVRAGLRAGVTLAPRSVLLGGLGACLLLVLVPPLGSADHLSYVAYGRIAAAGDDPYAVAPIDWRGGTDPVAGAVQPPWQRTPDVYGPVATQAFALVARLGAGDLRLTVWWWQLGCALAFLAVGLLLDVALRDGDAARSAAARSRAAVLWTLNPLLLGQLVLGAHVDALAAAFAVAALVAGLRRPLLAGLAVGAAAATKAPYVLSGLGLLCAAAQARTRWYAWVSGLIGGAAVVVPLYLLAGPHVLDQFRAASGFTSIASPWRAVVNLVELGTGRGSLRGVVVPVAVLLSLGLAVLVVRRLRTGSGTGTGTGTGTAVSVAFALTLAWVLLAPYALPWYDAIVWAPLALIVAPAAAGLRAVETALLARLLVLCVAYAPGRVVGLSPAVEALTLGVRRWIAPALVLLSIVAVVRWARARRDQPTPAQA